jgi:O-antigen/teichoic acid export membrane protein
MTADEEPSATAPRQPAGERGTYRSGFLFGSLSFVAVAALGVVSTIVTARVYGVRIIGQYAIVWAPVGALWVLSSVKEQQALIREITSLAPRDPRVTELFSAVFTFSLALTLTMSALAAAICWFVFRGPLHASGLTTPAFVTIAGYALIMNTGWNIDSILSAFVAGRQIFWVRVHEVVSFMAIALAVGLVWRSVWGLVIGIVGASLTSLVHRAIVVRPFVSARLTRAGYRRGLQVLPELLRFGLKATPGAIAQGISQQGGVWALGTIAPLTLVGAYSRAQTIPQRLQTASNRITEVLYPTLVGRHSTGDRDGFDRALIDSIRYETAGMLLIAAAIGGAAHAVLGLFGPGFGRASTALVLLILFPVLASITLTQTQALWAVDRPGRTSVIALVRLLVTVVLLVLLTPPLGIVGPALALLAGYLVVVVLNGISLRSSLARPLRATWPLRQRLALPVAYATGFGAAYGLSNVLPGTLALPLDLAVGVLAYSVAFVACGAVNQRDRERLTSVLAAVRSRARRPSPTPQPVCAE